VLLLCRVQDTYDRAEKGDLPRLCQTAGSLNIMLGGETQTRVFDLSQHPWLVSSIKSCDFKSSTESCRVAPQSTSRTQLAIDRVSMSGERRPGMSAAIAEGDSLQRRAARRETREDVPFETRRSEVASRSHAQQKWNNNASRASPTGRTPVSLFRAAIPLERRIVSNCERSSRVSRVNRDGERRADPRSIARGLRERAQELTFE